MDRLLFGLTLFSVLVQGGYFPTVYLIAAAALAAAAPFQKRRAPCMPELLLWGLAAVYLWAALAGGYASDCLAQACLPSACALFLSRFLGLEKAQKDRLLDWLAAGSPLLAGAAILSFCGVLPLTGAVTSHRLQFTFQYANAAGIWFAAMALLARERRRTAVPSIAALMLTRSVGAVGAYCLALAADLFRNRKNGGAWRETVLSHALAGGFAAAFYFLDGWASAPVLVLLCAACLWERRVLDAAVKLRLHWAAAALGVCAGTAILFSRRFASGLMTFAERLSQIRDGAAVIAEHPLAGLGAGNWAYFYPYYQSAQYTSTVVHSGPVQLGVDSGLAAVAIAAAFLVLAWRRGGAGPPEKLAAAMLLLHSAVDFTLQFFPICALLLALLFSGEEPREGPGWTGRLPLGVSLAAGALCGVMLWTELETKRLVRDVQDGSWSAVVERYEARGPLFGRSRAARECFACGLYYTGQWDRVVETVRSIPAPSTRELLMEAQALRELGDRDGACVLLLDQLERQLYRVVMFEQVGQRLVQWDAEERYLDRYDRIVDLANESQTMLGVLQGDQVHIEHLKRELKEEDS